MKKTLYLLLILCVTTLLGCQHEDVYNPKEKILSIMDYQYSSKTPYISFIYDQEKISKAVFYDQSKFQFEYNEDDQVTIIYGFTGNQSYGHVNMTYIDKKLSKVEYFDNSNRLFQMDTFLRYHGDIYAYKTFMTGLIKNAKENFLNESQLYKTYMNQQNMAVAQKVIEMTKGDLIYLSYTNVKYTKDNITELETVYQNGFTTLSKFTYDDQKNPLYGLPFALVDYLKFPSSPLTSYCKNNFKSSTYAEYYETPVTGTTTTYDLVYQKNDYLSQIYTNTMLDTYLRWQFNYVE
ncbi:MAG: hypothetical protein H6Q25_1128 [Bacteroidetes bacterium]|nr:hypothetical protein [Bacteroidota bacterium]